ncbi:hypothetical protein [Sphingomonas sp.]|uniref:hypothetical protein n=1 Tax=Sphingomonas sp. TaxID=28214 RepID=UPI001B2DF94E|nr:hypothetical protein [Sphingomonas sp.]MBO9714972.1 hypothetical protein [Sphingomonas sp.]
MRWTGIAVLALACGWSGSAAAQGTVEFKVGDTVIVATPPKGYCPPAGDAIATARMTAAADSANVTLATFYPCGKTQATQEDYFLVKAPVQALALEIDRDTALDQLSAALNKPEVVDDAAEATSKQLSDRTSAMAGKPVSVKSSIRFTGRDDVCAYLGGTVGFASPDPKLSVTTEVGVCMTVVAKKLVAVYRYRKAGPDPQVETLQRSARNFAEGLEGKAAQ